jgi:hypothetical protein
MEKVPLVGQAFEPVILEAKRPVSWLLQAGSIDALPIQLRGIDRLLTHAARIAHGMIPIRAARKRAVDVRNSTTPAKMKSACITPRSEARRESRQA